MHRPVRQIEVFDISLMAVVTKAMGAFLVIMLLLMPYYRSDPNVTASAKDARKTMEEARQQIEAMQRQLAASPEDVAALKRALAAMAETLAQAEQQIIALSKQAEALSAQARQAREEADAAQARLEAETAAAEAARAEAEQAKAEAGQAKAEAGQAKAEAGQARAEARQAQLAEVQMEQEANGQARAARQAETALSQSEQSARAQFNTESDQLRALLARSVLAPRRLVILSAVVPPGCGDLPIRIGQFSADHSFHLPEGVALDVLDEADRRFYLTRSTPTFPFARQRPAAQPGDLARPDPAPPRVIGAAILPDPGRTSFLYARADQPPAGECRLEIVGRILNLETGAGEEIKRAAVLAAGTTTPDLVIMLSGEDADMVRPPTADDFATWRRVLPGLIRQLDTPAAKAAP